MAKSKLTTTVRSLIGEVANQNKITLRVYDAKRELVKGTISADAPVHFTQEVLDYARGILASTPGSQITVNDRKLILSQSDWAHVAKNITLLAGTAAAAAPVFDTAVRAKGRTLPAETDTPVGGGGPPRGLPKSGAPTKANARQVFDLNQRVEMLIEEKGDDATAYTTEEKELLAAFAGYGGLEKYGEDKSGRGLLYEFYTPEEVVQVMWKLCVKHGYDGGPWLEPSAGSGRFLKYGPANATAYEVNPTSAAILRVLYPEATVHHAHFETLFIEKNRSIGSKVDHLPAYDLCIGNPPYGKFTGLYAGMGEKKYTGMEAHIDYFMYRCLDITKSGGLVCMLVGAEPANGGKRFLEKGMYPGKEKIMEKAELVEAHVLAEGVFDRSSSIGEIILLRKI